MNQKKNPGNIWENWQNRKVNFPKRKHLKLGDLDKIPYYDEKDKKINIKLEREEQYVCNDYVNPNDIVLELGGRYGVVSCVINNKLENPTNHVVLEPDKNVLKSLRQNRTSHKSKFKIVNGIISSSPDNLFLNLDDYASNISIKNRKSSHQIPVKKYRLKQLEDKYDLKFNTVVADCEGCLEVFFEENKHFISKQMKKIIFEKDLPKKCNYKKIISILRKNGFKPVVTGFVNCYIKSSLEMTESAAK